MNTVNIADPNYPRLLQAISNPPEHIHYVGNCQPELFSSCISVVGSRRMSDYGYLAVKKLLRGLSEDITVVSGFMRGIDCTAHEFALKYGLKTIAVLPYGIELARANPRYTLYKRILDSGGVVMSEYPASTPPKKWTFINRNRLVAGLSKVTLVVEAALNSGSLITAKFAKEYLRTVAVVPGSIFSSLSLGCFALLKSGAVPIYSGDCILSLFGKESYPMSGSSQVKQLSTIEPKVYLSLATMPKTAEEVCQSVTISIPELSSILITLQLLGLVTEKGGTYYASKD